jgi:hypothetical protein
LPPPAPSRPSPPAPAQARKSGGGAGLILGLGAAGLLFVALAAGAGWYFFLRKPATQVTDVTPTPGPPIVPSAEPSVAPTPVAITTPEPTAVPPTAVPVVPTPATNVTRPTSAPPTPAPTPKVAMRDNPPPPPIPENHGGSFLDAEPEDGIDGRAAGQDLANKYRSGQGYGSTSSPSTGARFRQRERSPRPQAPVERPAIATLRHVMNAQEAYHHKNNRYGSLKDLAAAQTLFLDVAFQPTSFQRANYKFDMTVDADGFRVVAVPMSAGGRPFVGDDSGFIRAGVD